MDPAGRNVIDLLVVERIKKVFLLGKARWYLSAEEVTAKQQAA
jgi:hypothetical protein